MFEFRSYVLRAFLLHRQVPNGVPEYVLAALEQLGNEVRCLVFEEGNEGRVVRSTPRSYTEICSLVDWAAAIQNNLYGERVATEALVQGDGNGFTGSSRDEFVFLLRMWHDFDAPDEPVYMCANRYPPPYLMAPLNATLGNICAALGLAILDRLVVRQELGALSAERQLTELGATWQCAELASRHNQNEILTYWYEHGWTL